MSVVKLKEEKQKKLKVLSKIIEVLAIIAKVCCYIALVCVIISAIIIPAVINNIEVKEDEILFDKESVIKVEEKENEIVLKSGNNVIAKTTDEKDIKEIKNFFSNTPDKAVVIGCVELCVVLIVVSIVLTILFLKHFIKLFKNINQEDTPFTLDNVVHIRKMAYYMIALIVIPALTSTVIDAFFHSKVDLNLESFSLMEILILFVLAYIFEYGYELQQDSKGKIYGKEEKKAKDKED